MTLDIPEEVRRKVVADGNAAWLDQLPSVVESLAQDWSLAIGASLRGGHAALVVEATLADGTAAVLKVGVPGTRRELGFEAAVLRLADGDGCASLLDSESALLPAPCGGRTVDTWLRSMRWCGEPDLGPPRPESPTPVDRSRTRTRRWAGLQRNDQARISQPGIVLKMRSADESPDISDL